MYKIYADDILIYDDTSSDPYYKVASPTLTLELGAAGSLKMTIPPGNAGYETIERMSTTIRVEKDGGTIWEGRVLQEDGDFWNQRILFCEGALAYLNDSVQEQRTISFADYGWGVDMALGALIDWHNNHVTANRSFVVGTVTVMGSLDGTDLTVDYGSTIEAIQKNLIGQYGGYLHVRFTGGTRYLDYLEKPGGVTSNHNTQVIEFGKNLMDFTKSFDASEFATVLLPLGAKQSDSEEGSDSGAYLTVASANGGSIYVVNETAVNNYGRIEKVIHFDDVNDATELLQKATLYLSGLQFDKMQISLTAFDLHYLNSEIEGVKLGESIRVKSTPHGLDTELPVQKLDIPLDRPQDTAFELGGEIKVGFTSASNQINEELFMQINQAVDRDAILDAASAHVASLMNQILNGYITLETETDESGNIHSEALYISPQPMSENPQNYWRWSMTGLGYTSDGGTTWDTAITMDGTILGERIAAASIHGTQISADAFTLVTSAGQGALTMRVAPRVLAPDAFEIGRIAPINYPNPGTNVPDSKYARTKGKIRLEKDSTLYVGVYNYEVFEYSNNTSPESGFLNDYGQPSGIFTVPRTNYYRLVLSKDDNSSITTDDLAKMPEAVSIDGVSTVISADDLKIVGCVRFEDLSGNGTTEINGANIMTGTVTAEKINAYGLTIKKRGVGDEDDPTTWTGDTTFEIDEDGNVYIDAQIDLSASSQISFSGGTTTLGAMINGIEGSQEMAAKIADGQPFDTVEINGTTYTGTFINGQNIYSPNIYANVFTAQPLTDSSGNNNTGAFILKGYYGGILHDVFKVSFIGGGSDISTTYIESWGDTISLPHVIELRDDGTSANTGAYIRAGNRGTGNTLDSLIRYASLQGAFKVDGVLNTGGGGNSQAFLVVNNGTQSPEDYFNGRTVPVGTVYFQWAY